MQRRSRSFRALSAFAIAAAAATSPGLARAQSNQGFALDRFDPSERGSEWFVMDTLDFRGDARPAAGLVGEYSHAPLVVYNADGSTRTNLVSDQLFLHAGGSLVLGKWVRLGADVPVALYDTGNGAVVGGTPLTPPDRAAMGDVRLSADARLYGHYGEQLTIAAGMSAFIPSGEASQYAGDGSVRLMPRVLAAGQVKWFAYSAKLGVMFHWASETFAGTPIDHELVFGAAAGARLADGKLLVGPELYGSTVFSDAFAAKTTPLELLLGGHYTIARDWRAGAGVGPGLTRGLGTPEWRAVLSAEWAPAPPPPPPPAPVPVVVGDRDHDGVPDDQDACPDVPGVRTDDPKTNGCPPPPPPDRDHDGVIDSEDACPDVPGVKTDDPKTNGCPPDRDHDGVVDAEDACPDVPGVKTDDPKTNGCPPPDPDRDKDGIVNEQDACPDVPGEHTDDPKTNGCPKAYVQNGEIKINQQVKFKFNSAVILSDSDAILTAVAAILKEHPEIDLLRIEGHTDNVGTKTYNKALSEKRAASVLKWLTSHGIDKKRLVSHGYGLEKPIDTNATDEGRKNNRRVEFHIEKQADATKPADAKPTDAKPADPAPPAPSKP